MDESESAAWVGAPARGPLPCTGAGAIPGTGRVLVRDVPLRGPRIRSAADVGGPEAPPLRVASLGRSLLATVGHGIRHPAGPDRPVPAAYGASWVPGRRPTPA